MKKALALSLLPIAAMTAMSTQAHAQTLPFGSSIAAPYTSGKTEAILGGSSRLAAIMASQAAAPAPASQGAFAAAQALITPAAVVPTYAPVSPDRPDVFGSVALSIDHTPLDRYWRAVSASTPGAAATAYANQVSAMSALERVDAVNRYVNARVTYTNDYRLNGVEDRWSGGKETLSKGRGDCEDFAIAKMQMLQRAGFDAKDLYIVVLRDTRRNTDHAVAVVRAEGRLLVLDNGTNRIVDSAMLPEYRPIFSFSAGKSWTHGYRRPQPTVTLAATEGPATVAMAMADRIATAALVPAPSAN